MGWTKRTTTTFTTTEDGKVCRLHLAGSVAEAVAAEATVEAVAVTHLEVEDGFGFELVFAAFSMPFNGVHRGAGASTKLTSLGQNPHKNSPRIRFVFGNKRKRCGGGPQENAHDPFPVFAAGGRHERFQVAAPCVRWRTVIHVLGVPVLQQTHGHVPVSERHPLQHVPTGGLHAPRV